MRCWGLAEDGFRARMVLGLLAPGPTLMEGVQACRDAWTETTHLRRYMK